MTELFSVEQREVKRQERIALQRVVDVLEKERESRYPAELKVVSAPVHFRGVTIEVDGKLYVVRVEAL